MLDNTQNTTEIRNPCEMYGSGRNLKKVLSLIGIVLMIASVSAYAFFVRPFWNDYKQVQADISSKEQTLKDLKDKIASFKDTETKMDLGSEVAKMTLINSIPVGLNQDGVIEDLVKIAAAHDIKLRSVSFGRLDDFKKDVGALKINASFEGNYGDLINFLEGIEENPRFFKVTSINVQVNNMEDLDVKRVTFALAMDAFYQ